jgi:hypothetical protein
MTSSHGSDHGGGERGVPVRSWGPWPHGCTRSRPTVAVSESYWGGEAEVKRQRPGGATEESRPVE